MVQFVLPHPTAADPGPVRLEPNDRPSKDLGTVYRDVGRIGAALPFARR
jgi:hypothetical protein